MEVPKNTIDCFTQKTSVNVSAATVNQSNDVLSFSPKFSVSIESGSKRLITYAFLDSASTVSFLDQSVNEKLFYEKKCRFYA